MTHQQPGVFVRSHGKDANKGSKIRAVLVELIWRENRSYLRKYGVGEGRGRVDEK